MQIPDIPNTKLIKPYSSPESTLLPRNASVGGINGGHKEPEHH